VTFYSKKVILQMHRDCVAAWKKRQLRTHDYVHLEEIVDWCGRLLGELKRNDELSIATYRELDKSIMSGEFDRNGRSTILADLGPQVSDPAFGGFRLEAHKAHKHDAAYCWFTARVIALPPWLANSGNNGQSVALTESPVQRLHVLPAPLMKKVNRSAAYAREYVANFYTTQNSAGLSTSQKALREKWNEDGNLGMREVLNAELARINPRTPGRPKTKFKK
jgi:hypothetical protein